MDAAARIASVCEVARAHRALGGECVALPTMTLVRDAERTDIWDANHAGGITAASPPEIAEVFAACDRLLPEGVRHRQFRCDPRTPQAFVAHLEWAGFTAHASIQMLLEGELSAGPVALEVRLADSDGDWRSVLALTRLDHEDGARREGRAVYSPGVTERLVKMRRRMQPEVRMWLARRAGEDVGYFSSWPGSDGIRLVEWLFTRADQRRRGVATALIAHAVADARARGARAIVIGPDAGDYDDPRRLYAALGFVPVCVTHAYTRLSA